MSMENHCGMISRGETTDSSTRDPYKFYQKSHLVAKHEELAKKIMNFASRSFYFILRRVHAVKYFDMGPTPLLPFRKNACCGFLSSSIGFESANLGSSGKHANHETTEDDHEKHYAEQFSSVVSALNRM
jgi:hypothetical protein